MKQLGHMLVICMFCIIIGALLGKIIGLTFVRNTPKSGISTSYYWR